MCVCLCVILKYRFNMETGYRQISWIVRVSIENLSFDSIVSVRV